MKKSLFLVLVINTFLCLSAYADYTFTDNREIDNIRQGETYTYNLGTSVDIIGCAITIHNDNILNPNISKISSNNKVWASAFYVETLADETFYFPDPEEADVKYVGITNISEYSTFGTPDVNIMSFSLACKSNSVSFGDVKLCDTIQTTFDIVYNGVLSVGEIANSDTDDFTVADVALGSDYAKTITIKCNPKSLGKKKAELTISGQTIATISCNGAPLDAPANLHIEDATTTSFTAVWDAVTDASDYTSTINDGGSSTGTETRRTFTGLTPDTSYAVRVTTNYNGIPCGTQLAILRTERLAAPTDLISSDITDVSASLSWSQVDGNEGYEIYVYTPGSLLSIYDTDPDQNSLKIEGLNPNANYNWRVFALYGDRQQNPSNTSSFTTNCMFTWVADGEKPEAQRLVVKVDSSEVEPDNWNFVKGTELTLKADATDDKIVFEKMIIGGVDIYENPYTFEIEDNTEVTTVFKEGQPTGVHDESEQNVLVYVSDGKLVVEGAEGQNYQLILISGITLKSGKISTSTEEIPLQDRGVYMLKLTDKTYKVLNNK
ncbi:MAG: fibronectin type III domain-containing protein [Paludibacteraceae bacterium]|nr:fibronectin type III domain-containing protein [Paludibacteraceae bacterium]